MSKPRHVSRRQFLKATAAATAAALATRGLGAGGAPPAHTAPATGTSDFTVGFGIPEGPPNLTLQPLLNWARSLLKSAIISRGITINEPVQASDFGISLLVTRTTPDALPESFSITPSTDPVLGKKYLTLSAPDPRGLAYAATELADRVRLSADPRAALTLSAPLIEKPATPYRGIVRLVVSETEDKRWFYDREGWQKYFDMLVTHRFNHFNLSFGLSYDFSTNLTDTYTFFLYPFMVNVPGYNVRAIAKGGAPLPEEEQKKNLDALKFISDQAALRGLKFTLGIWTHNYRWTNSPNATYTIDGLDAQSQAPYSRDAMKMLIDACPGITGINLRTHGESGIPEGSYDLWKIIMSGMVGHKNADGTPRILELDLHGKTMTQEMIDTAAATGMPLIISCKHWAEHAGLPYIQASIRESEMPKANTTGLMALSSGSRSFLRYGIGDLVRKDRNYKLIHRVWPGSQKVLLWGDPLFAAENGRMANFAGTDGIDYFEPMSFRGRAGSSLNNPPAPDRSGYADASLRAERDWEKYAYTFRLWGRLSYNPDADPETWRRQLAADYGTAAVPLESALANTSRILLLTTVAHDPSAAGDSYWPENYTNQSLYDDGSSPYSEVPNPKVFGNVSPLDPQIFSSANEYVEALLSNKASAKISPVEVARQLETWSQSATQKLTNLRKMEESLLVPTAQFRRAQIDATIAAGLGAFFAHKFRAAVLWQLFNRSGHEAARAAAVESYKKARDAWADLAQTANVYLPTQTYGGRNLRGHWSDRLSAIDKDIAGLAAARPLLSNTDYSKETIDKLILAVTNPAPNTKKLALDHTPSASFKPGEAIRLWASEGGTLYYRRLHQGERYQSLPTEKADAGYVAVIPAEYTKSPYPIQYYFEIHTENATALYPGFKENFTGTPYFVIMPA